jgi:hypothetical protein
MTSKESNLTRDIILDLLPIYLAGEASADTCIAIESFAQTDSEISNILQAGDLSMADLHPIIEAPKNLESKTIARLQHTIRKQILYVAMATISILMVPFIAMMFTKEVNWSPADFIVMGCLLMAAGIGYVVVANLSDSLLYKLATAIAVFAGFLLIWANLAVGIIGQSGDTANLLYGLVFATAIVGAIKSKLTAKGLAKTMFATALVQLLVPVFAWLALPDALEQSQGFFRVQIINGVFTALFLCAGLLFRRVDLNQLK